MKKDDVVLYYKNSKNVGRILNRTQKSLAELFTETLKLRL